MCMCFFAIVALGVSGVYWSILGVCSGVLRVCHILWCPVVLNVRVLLFSCLAWSIRCDADRMLVAISLSWYRLGKLSNSNPGMVPARRRIRSVGSLRVLVSRASNGQWLKLGDESSFRVFVHGVCWVFYSHLCGYVPGGGKPQPGFFECALDTLRGEVREKPYGLSHCLIEDAVYGRELTFVEDSEVGCVIFGFK